MSKSKWVESLLEISVLIRTAVLRSYKNWTPLGLNTIGVKATASARSILEGSRQVNSGAELLGMAFESLDSSS